MSSIADQIIRRIRGKKRGWVFTPKDFSDLGARTAVDQVLSRLTKQGIIRRLGRGVYDFPRQSSLLGTLSPNSDLLAQATAKKGDNAFPSGAVAANMLGLSTQVPAKPVYLTNGSSRTRQIGNRIITLKRARIPWMDHLSHRANSILQALYYLGKDNIDSQVILHCANLLDNRDLKDLLNAINQAPSWLADIILRVKQAKYGHIHNQIGNRSSRYS
jgi:hypothetical protein